MVGISKIGTCLRMYLIATRRSSHEWSTASWTRELFWPELSDRMAWNRFEVEDSINGMMISLLDLVC